MLPTRPRALDALDVEFLYHALFEHGHAGFLRRDVDQDFVGHVAPAYAKGRDAAPGGTPPVGGALGCRSL